MAASCFRFRSLPRNPARSGIGRSRQFAPFAPFHRNPARSGIGRSRQFAPFALFHRNPARSGLVGCASRSFRSFSPKSRSLRDRPFAPAAPFAPFHRNPACSGIGCLCQSLLSPLFIEIPLAQGSAVCVSRSFRPFSSKSRSLRAGRLCRLLLLLFTEIPLAQGWSAVSVAFAPFHRNPARSGLVGCAGRFCSFSQKSRSLRERTIDEHASPGIY